MNSTIGAMRLAAVLGIGALAVMCGESHDFAAPEEAKSAPSEALRTEVPPATAELEELLVTLALAQQAPLFAEVRLGHGGTDESADSWVSDELAASSIDPVSIPVGPLGRQLGRSLVAQERTGSASEVSGDYWSERLLVAAREVETDYAALLLELEDSSIEAALADARRAEILSLQDGRRSPISDPAPQTRDWAAEVAERLSEAEGLVDEDGRVSTTVIFYPRIDPDVEWRIDWLSGLNGASTVKDALREAELRVRQPVVQAAIDAGLSRIASVGCEVTRRMRAVNGVRLRCTPEQVHVLVTSLPGGIADFSLGHGETEVGTANLLDGGEYRSVDGSLQVGLAITEGYDGEGPTWASSDNVVVGLIDEQGFFKIDQHPALWDYACYNPWNLTCGGTCFGISSRVIGGMRCGQGGCTTGDYYGTHWNHGARIMAAFSDTTQAQDPCVTPTSDPNRVETSYGSSEASIRVYRNDDDADGEYEAMQQAALDGVDIVSISQDGGRDACDNARSHSPVIAAGVDYLVSLDVHQVRLAHNAILAYSDDCYIGVGAAVRPEVIVVGGVYDESETDAAYDAMEVMGAGGSANLHAYPNCPSPGGSGLCWSSGVGGADLRANGALRNRARGIIDIVAPAALENTPRYSSSGTSWDYVMSATGTSVATPAAASALVSTIDWARVNGYSLVDEPGILNVLTLLMGDGAAQGAANSHRPAAAPSYSSGLDRLLGAGRLRHRSFTNAGMDGPWGAGWAAFTMSPGTTSYFKIGGGPMYADVEAFTVALSWKETNLDSALGSPDSADFLLSIVSTAGSSPCPSTPQGYTRYHWWDWSYDVQKRIRLRGSELGSVQGRCVYGKVEYFSGSGTRTVYRADYWEDLDRECAEDLGQCGNSSCGSDPGCVL